MTALVKTEIKTAKKIYRWLWLSPFLTIPTLIFIILIEPGAGLICGGNYNNCNHALSEKVSLISAFLISALWHLSLLIPASNKESEFVRWHGRQALLLAGIRTLIPLAFLTYGLVFDNGYYGDTLLWSIPTLILIWLVGTLWGQNQAAIGECSLMHWTGRGNGLPVKPEKNSELEKISHGRVGEEPEELIEIFRYNRDPEQRKAALAELERLGLVEPFSD